MPEWPQVRQAHPAADSGLLIRTGTIRRTVHWRVATQEDSDAATTTSTLHGSDCDQHWDRAHVLISLHVTDTSEVGQSSLG
ncbi:Protocadherin-16 [Manis pentadactyla]|nr:Protocadherin-16 [Manis pentadactyla]